MRIHLRLLIAAGIALCSGQCDHDERKPASIDERKPAANSPVQPTGTPTLAPEQWYGRDNDAIRSSNDSPSLSYGTEAAGMTYGQVTSTTSLSTSDEFDTVDDSEILALDLDSIIAHRNTGAAGITYGLETSTTTLSTSVEFDTVDDREFLSLDLDSIIAYRHTGTHIESSWSIEDIEEANRRSLCEQDNDVNFEHDTAVAIRASLGDSITTHNVNGKRRKKALSSRRRVRGCTGSETKGELKSPPEELDAVPTSMALVPTSTALVPTSTASASSITAPSSTSSDSTSSALVSSGTVSASTRPSLVFCPSSRRQDNRSYHPPLSLLPCST